MIIRKLKNITVVIALMLGIFAVYPAVALPKEPVQPNLILITLDSLRPDHLSCYGYKRNTSPNIDKFAKEGVMFDCAIAQATATQVSVPSFITSTYPYMHLARIDTHDAYINPYTKTLAEILKANGYTTALFTDHPNYFGRIHGIKEHFDSKVELRTDHPQELTDFALEWLKANKNKKFFTWLYYFGSHSGYESASPYSDEFFKDKLAEDKRYIQIQTDKYDRLDTIPKHVVKNNITDVSYYVARYDGKIHIVDDQLGRLLEGIKNLGLDKNTLIVLLADHGEGLGEHDYYFRHGGTFYDELLKVPLVMRYPGVIPQDKIIDSQVRLLDLVPTVMDFLGISKDAGKKYRYMEGKSLRSCIQGNNCAGEKYAFSYTPMLSSLRVSRYKIIKVDFEEMKTTLASKIFGYYYQNEYELYDLKKDPFEKDNLVEREKALFPGLKQELDAFIKKAKAERARAKKRIQEYYKLTDTEEPLDEATKEKLKSIGYLQ